MLVNIVNLYGSKRNIAVLTGDPAEENDALDWLLMRSGKRSIWAQHISLSSSLRESAWSVRFKFSSRFAIFSCDLRVYL